MSDTITSAVTDTAPTTAPTGPPVPGGPPDDGSPGPLRHTWSQSDRFVPRAFVRPLQRFMQLETAGGVFMLAAAVVALVWANSPAWEAYRDLFGAHITVELGSLDLEHLAHLTVRDWINDALMAVFFFLVGLEIKRELVHGELRDPRKAALPAIAAVGGMVLPALIYTVFNAGGPGAHGWGVPMATDIAFAVGVVALLGNRVPSGAKVFLLTLAIADDIGAIIVIAVFYSDSPNLAWLATAGAAVGAMVVMQRIHIRALPPYLAAGVVAWLAMLESGVHATLAGVAIGLITPAWSFYDPRRFGPAARRMIDAIERRFADGTSHDDIVETEATLEDLTRLATETMSPLERIEHRLAPWVAFGIVPLFALANAGVRVVDTSLADVLTEPVTLGVALGLVVGKTLGVFTATWLGSVLGLGRLPSGTSWRHVFGLAIAAGIGFTVALFVAGLAFEDPALNDLAKVGILGGSLVAGTAAYLFLRTCPSPEATTGTAATS